MLLHDGQVDGIASRHLAVTQDNLFRPLRDRPIDPKTTVQTTYTVPPPAAGGGIDDVAFLRNNVYISASAPANNPNLAPAILQATLNGTSVTLTPILLGNSNATDITTGNLVA